MYVCANWGWGVSLILVNFYVMGLCQPAYSLFNKGTIGWITENSQDILWFSQELCDTAASSTYLLLGPGVTILHDFYVLSVTGNGQYTFPQCSE